MSFIVMENLLKTLGKHGKGLVSRRDFGKWKEVRREMRLRPQQRSSMTLGNGNKRNDQVGSARKSGHGAIGT